VRSAARNGNVAELERLRWRGQEERPGATPARPESMRHRAMPGARRGWGGMNAVMHAAGMGMGGECYVWTTRADAAVMHDASQRPMATPPSCWLFGRPQNTLHLLLDHPLCRCSIHDCTPRSGNESAFHSGCRSCRWPQLIPQPAPPPARRASAALLRRKLLWSRESRATRSKHT
jgi:hypothetical protein